MELTPSTKTVPAAILLATGLVLGACSSGDSSDAAASASAAGSGQASATATATEAGSASASASSGTTFSDVDVRFTQSMLPHHGQAVRTSRIEIERGSSPEVIALAQKILDAQLEEIDTMQGFLRTFGADEVPPPADQQAVWDSNAEALRDAATPEERDLIFLTNMVPHHSAAVPMSQVEIDRGTYPAAVTLAMDIKTTQREEIKEMNMMIRARA